MCYLSITMAGQPYRKPNIGSEARSLTSAYIGKNTAMVCNFDKPNEWNRPDNLYLYWYLVKEHSNCSASKENRPAVRVMSQGLREDFTTTKVLDSQG